MLAALAPAFAQEPPPVPPAEIGAPPPSQPPPPAPGGAPPAFQPGFVDAVGRWINEGAAKLKSDMQGAHETFGKVGDRMRDAAKDAAGAAKDAAGAALPNARITTGRERCMLAPNGAPDCELAAKALCKGKGFQAGKSLDTQAERNCSPGPALLAGRPPSEIECRNEMFVTRAMCH